MKLIFVLPIWPKNLFGLMYYRYHDLYKIREKFVDLPKSAKPKGSDFDFLVDNN